MQGAGITLVKGDLMGIVRARRLSAAAMRHIRQIDAVSRHSDARGFFHFHNDGSFSIGQDFGFDIANSKLLQLSAFGRIRILIPNSPSAR